MITTPEQREALVKEGWKFKGSHMFGEEWHNNSCELKLRRILPPQIHIIVGEAADLALIARAAAILGVK